MKGLKKVIDSSELVLHGVAAAPGLVKGTAYLYNKEVIKISDDQIDDVDSAIASLYEAVERSKKELNKIFSIAREKMGEKRAEIFEAQLMILDDPILLSNIEYRIKDEKKLPEFLVYDEITKYQDLMILAHDPYMKERALDIEDIKNRIIRNLQKKRWASKFTNDVIVVSGNLTPADTILFTKNDVLGYVTDHGGLTSHAAIVARSLNLPAVLGTHNATMKIKEGDFIVIDGFHGLVFVNPKESELKYFDEKIAHLKEINEQQKELITMPSETKDGRLINLRANVDVTGEIEMVISNGAAGIGLYRSEQIIEEIGSFPDEEEQTKIYKKLAERIYPDSVTIRAFDIGGDKVKPLHIEESNPFLGLRGIRFLLENENIFRAQTRAVLKASRSKNVQYMIPMISTVEEVVRFKKIISECRHELHQQHIPFDEQMKVGIMVEVPSAAVMAAELSRLVDFFSIGTNDLIQYLIAVDRGNDLVSPLYQEFNPSVIRTISFIIKEAEKSGIEVSICGEMAADTLAVPILIGLGMKTLSISPSALLYIKRVVREISFEGAKNLAEDCLQLTSQTEVLHKVEHFFKTQNIQRTRNIL